MSQHLLNSALCLPLLTLQQIKLKPVSNRNPRSVLTYSQDYKKDYFSVCVVVVIFLWQESLPQTRNNK